MQSESHITFAQPHALPPADQDYLISRIRTIPNFPKEGVLFRDFMPVLADVRAFSLLIDALLKSLPVNPDEFDAIAGLEARGFLFGPVLADRLGKSFIAVRKAGKLPPPVHTMSYSLEYGESVIEIEQSAISEGERILIVDDLIATGGSALAARDLVIACKGEVAGFSFVMELDGLGGVETLGNSPVSSLLTMPA